MKHAALLLITALLATTPAFALTPQESFERLNECVKQPQPNLCRDYVTASSVALYDRFVAHDIVPCIPKDITYLSGQPDKGGYLIRAQVTAGENQRVMRLIWVEEEGQWKLDVPQSLRRGMGDKWEQQVNLTEQLYVVMKNQMGGALHCGLIQNLASSPQAKQAQP